MKLVTPDAVSVEHQELHVRLSEAARLEGPLGEAARVVARLLQPHFVREETVAMPPLGLLRRVAEGKVTAEMAEVFPLIDALREDLPRLIAEHQQIIGALTVFCEVAGREDRLDWLRFAEDLIRHLRTEEDVLYPAALLVGEYLKAKLPAAVTAGERR